MHSISDERNWLTWLVKVRILILTVLLAIELAVIRLTPSPLPIVPFLTAMVLWFVLSLFFLFLVSVWSESRLQAMLQVLSDLAMVTLIVHLTGGIDSSLNFLYPLVIIVACMLLPRSWGFLSAALAFILYGAILELDYYGAIPSFSTSHPKLKALQVVVFVNLFAYFAIAYLAGLLVTKLRQADVRLQDASGALENLQALHENIVQSMSGGVITTGLDGRVTLANRAAQQLLEIVETELRGRSVTDLFQDPLPHVGSGRGDAEVRYAGGNGFRKTFRVTVSALNVTVRGDLGFVYTFDDLTEIRRLEREVRLQDRLAAVGRLAAAIAHEIRNPLTSIAGSVSMLSDAPALSDEQRKLLQIVTRESDRLNNIITDFLAYSRGKQYRFERVNLLPLLQDTLTLLEHRLASENSGIHLTRHFAVAEAWVLADGDKLKQVFWNFSENAVRAMKKTGGSLTAALVERGPDWEMSFTDTGPGISPQQTEKIFEPFQSNFEGGTGLGLAIVYQIVQAHEGKVWARSEVGKGTSFVVRLRRMEQGAPAVPDASQSGAAAAGAAAGGGTRG
ncbi:MAG: PAS domain S-box protein [Acidobacteriales bacterium]|nr:PAS domain S-box protein [Candidatus Koribacter versatilis]MBI3646457.1 PAS domain S-box protein [Terriglobales bacterium]